MLHQLSETLYHQSSNESVTVPETLHFTLLVWLCRAGRPQGCDLDGCVPDSGNVCRPAGSDCGGDQSDRRHTGGVEESCEWQSHFWPRVSEEGNPVFLSCTK